ncbi:MAG: S9 family peptidase [Candidatus Aminicenantes bacterium]|nr:S9 family peptidase [Candidatus Aminicenantes bacterium]
MKRQRLSLIFLFLLTIGLIFTPAKPVEKRKISLEDFYEFKEIRDLSFSPDNKWLSYTVIVKDKEKKSRNSDLWMIPVEGGPALTLTYHDQSDTQPRWSPNGRYLAFLSNRSGKNQIWLFNTQGGEPYQLTRIESDIEKFSWSPDSSTIAFLAKDPKIKERKEQKDKMNEEREEDKNQEIIVVNRLQHKRDGEGYLDNRYTHIWLVSISTGETRKLTDGPYDEADICFSPDGREIAFSSNRTENPDGNRNTDIWAVDIKTGKIRQITIEPKPEANPCYSRDGRFVAYLQPSSPVYGTNFLWLIPAQGGQPIKLTASLDRNILPDFFWSKDNRYIYFCFEDSGNQSLARVEIKSGQIERLVSGEKVLRHLTLSPDGRYLAFVQTDSLRPAEIFVAHENDQEARKITSIHDNFIAQLNLTLPENIHYRSFDGQEIEGWLMKPIDFDANKKYPMIVLVHGGPNAQYDTSFNFEAQLFAAEGFVVFYSNPRGSSGYGEAFGRAIWADWGNKDLNDILAGIEHVLKKGFIDKNKLGIYGWSYGGILVNYAITKTNLFRAAISGASDSDYFSCYGTDDLHLWWEEELGLPWDNFDLYRRLSPIKEVKKVRTPTLFLCGQFDYRCPLPQSEQMYVSLKRLGVETELVIYPDESHELSQLVHQMDRLKRVLAWFNKYLK